MRLRTVWASTSGPGPPVSPLRLRAWLEALTQLNDFCWRWIDRLPHYEGSLLQDTFELYADTGWLLQQHRERLAEDPLQQIPVASRQTIAALRRKLVN
jgi:hypothetical protein